MESGSSQPQSPAPQAEAAPAPSPPPPTEEQPFLETDTPEVATDEEVVTDKGAMLIVMTAVDPNDLQQPPPPPPSASILIPADEFLISSAQLNEERRRKELGLVEGGEQAGPVFLTATHMAELGATEGAAPPRSDGDPDNWRAYYEHPLTAATSAMLNISGGGHEEQQTASMGFIYDYYKPQDKESLKIGPQANAATLAAASTLSDLWQTSNSGMLPPHHHKLTNGLSVGGAGLLAGPAHDYSSSSPAAPSAAPSPARDGADSPRRASPAGTELLFVTPGLSVKREPEDLSQPVPRKQMLLDRVVDAAKVASSRHGTDSVLVLGRKAVKDEFGGRGSPVDEALLLKAPIPPYATQMFGVSPGGGGATFEYAQQSQQSAANYAAASPGRTSSASYTEPYYRDYFGADYQRQYAAADGADSATGVTTSTASAISSAFVERYVRQSAVYKTGNVALTVDLPSPDSGIGTDAITPRDQTAIQQSFDYTDMCQNPLLPETLNQQRSNSSGSLASPNASNTSIGTPGGRSRPWHDFGRQNDADKVQIPKLFSQYGFRYFLETPISTSQRREDDRITYINKGQFYGITLEYLPDPESAIKFQTVKSVVMLMFREEKSPEDEIKAWQFWHSRQHSVKQRILDADTKNSVGLVGVIEEVAHNAIAVYWNPHESSAKINVAVQCLSTDFSSQKGVKGLPLHLQIDTYEDPRDGPVAHRGYSQIKVFCDKGAERKTRDEERRAAKRKMTATGRKKLDELYHPPGERSEFYSMSDLTKPPVLFSPAEDIDKLTSMELQGFYGHPDPDSSSLSNGDGALGRSHVASPTYLLHAKPLHHHPPTPTTLKFHNHFPPDHPGFGQEKKDVLEDTVFNSPTQPPLKRPKLQPSPSPLHHQVAHSPGGLGSGGPPPLSERVMLYVRQDSEDIYTPLHVVPPSTAGLMHAIESKYKISTSAISNLYRKNRRGITAKLDDDMLRYYLNEDLFIVEFKQVKGEDSYEVTLCEVDDR
ncbi:protein grainyhead isoform X2 [Neocloeon triangulifer]|uniref:protein grainyhead isoform X2 n=1 Tax=Neocloeon triangulifer TaxID=2078957 RepID=UPI00286F14BE|nr:protein grainyhead isoform X2 [Neocloeon triangulifer]